METLDFLEIESLVIKERFFELANEGLLLPVFDRTGQLNVKYASENGFTKRHIFVLYDIFKSHMEVKKTPEEILDFANEILYQILRRREIYEKLDSIIAKKKENGIY